MLAADTYLKFQSGMYQPIKRLTNNQKVMTTTTLYQLLVHHLILVHEEFEDTKEATRIRNRQHNGQ